MNLREMFPLGSKDFLAANEQPAPAENVVDHPDHVQKIRVPKGPNQTEAEFGRILEAQKQRGEILRYEYEGVTFRWSDMRYTPDWFVVEALAILRETQVREQNYIWSVPGPAYYRLKSIEVKGAHIWDRDIVRFKGARAMWPEIQFEMWQKKAGQWTRLF